MFPHVHVRVGKCEIAVHVHEVRQAVPLLEQGLSLLPRRSGALVGVADIAGSPVPIVDLARWLPLDAEQTAAVSPKLLILQHAGKLLGVRIDAVLGVKTTRLDAVRKVHHQPDVAELFEAVVPASTNSPTLCILEVARLMGLSGAWCEQAQVAASSAPAAFASADLQPKPAATTQRCAVFRVGTERWAIPVSAVERIAPVPTTELILRGHGRGWAISQWEGRKLALIDISEGRQASDCHTAPWMVLLSHGPLLLGLTVSECLQFVNLAPDALAGAPNDPMLLGVTLLPDGSKLKVLDTAQLFDSTPEASISRPSAPPSAQNVKTPPVDATEPCPYLVFDAGQRYASPVNGVLGVVELTPEARADLAAGHPSFLAWRGQTIRLVKLPAIGRSGENAELALAVIVQPHGAGRQPIAMAVQELTDWLPASSTRRREVRMGAVGELGLINAKGAEDHANLVVLDLAQMAYMLG